MVLFNTELYNTSRIGILPSLLVLIGGFFLRRPMVMVGHTSSQRSEEHTSELQSPCNLVCRLLLEKKNNHEYLPQHDLARCRGVNLGWLPTTASGTNTPTLRDYEVPNEHVLLLTSVTPHFATTVHG